MLNSNFDSKKQTATEEDTPTDVLEELSKDEDAAIREAVAGNPNTPVEVLKNLSEEFPEAVTGNPVFDLLLLDNPDSEFIRLSLARSSTTPQETLVKLVEHRDRKVRIAVAANVNTPLDLLERLASNPQEGIYLHEAIASNKSASPEILDKLLGDINEYSYFDIHRQMAKHPKTSALTLEKLASHREQSIRLEVLKHPCFSPHMREIVLCLEGKLTPDLSLFQKLANSPNYYTRLLVSKHPNIAAEILEQLANDDNEYVRAKVAQNPRILRKNLEKLAEHRV
ncbi:MAG: hypothetical protein QNJ32_02740 [Xenococcaceae cyanobacterium MO_167.B27]|nr:hypothetical protein [Xenococcaceae cyanobacterium MO_167.B27]